MSALAAPVTAAARADARACDLFGIPVAALTLSDVLDRVHAAVRRRERLHLGVVNAAKVVNMRRDPELRRAVLSSDLILADGASVVWASRLLRRGLPERVAGIDLMLAILERGSREGYRVFCLGATPAVVAGACARIAKEFPGVRVVGRRDGYFTEHEEPAVASAIAAARPDVLFVAMTSPRKERFLARWSGRLGVPVCHGVGGSFDVLAGKVRRAPAVWQRLGLEWLYRVRQEPQRLWRRYLDTNTAFCGLLLMECLRGSRLLSTVYAAPAVDARPDPVLAVGALQRDRPPVVLWGGLSLVRSLRLASIPVVLATSEPGDPATRSRHLAGVCPLPRTGGEQAVADALVRAGRWLHETLGRKVPLFCGNDEQLSFLYQHREALSRHYLLLLNEPALGQALLDKLRFEELGRRHGLPVPRSWPMTPEGRADLARAPGPKLLKPRRKMHFEESVLRRDLFDGCGKAVVFRDGRELLDHLPSGHVGEVSVQEYVPGGDGRLVSFHGFADAEGRLLAWFVGRKIRSFPVHTGESSFLELAHDDALAQLGRDVARRLGLVGIFKMDFKQDERDGTYYLLEVNARFSLWNYLGAANGVNLAQVAYDHLVHGKVEPPAAYRTRYKWLKLALDYRAFRELRASGRLTTAQWLRSILSTRAVYHCFAWTDPAPLLALWHRRAARALRRWHVTAS